MESNAEQSNSERSMHTKLTGVTMGGENGETRQQHIEGLAEALTKGEVELVLHHEEGNPFHQNAMKVYLDKELTKPLGYLKRELADDIVAGKKLGWTYAIFAEQVTGGGKGKSYGLNVKIIARK